MKIDEVLLFVKNKLLEKAEQLPLAKKVKVEIPKSVLNYKNTHINGTLLLIYRGDNFSGDKITCKKIIRQNRTMLLTVLGIIKSSNAENITWYIDYVINSLAGIQIANNSNENYILPISAERLEDDEFNNVCFAVTFSVPLDVIFNGDDLNENN
ncbi:MAG: hypothetical protein V1773_01035 [bacterium]